MSAVVDVVIPCKNAAEDVGAALMSLVPFGSLVGKIVCVDDGSTDSTAHEIRAAMSRLDMNIRIVELDGVGACAARNAGFSEVDAAYCQFLDADDLLLPGKLEGQIDVAERTGVDCVAGSYILRESAGAERVVDVDHDAWSGLVASRLGTTSSMLFKSSAVRSAGGWDETLASSQEYDLLLRILKNGGRIGSDRIPRTIKQVRVGAISNQDPLGRLTRFVNLRRRMVDTAIALDVLTPDLRQVADETVFRAIQEIYELDPGQARATYDELVSKAFIPGGSSARARFYRLAFRTIGFGGAERLRVAFDSLGSNS